MSLSTLLPLEGVKMRSSVSSKKRLMQDLGDLAEGCFGVDAEGTVGALLEREALGPTGVGQGVALPHARIDGLQNVHGLFVRLEKPIDFDAVDRQPVDLIFALLAPQDAGVMHLKALALVSRTLRDAALCSKLRANTDPATLYAILTADMSVKAA